jgi:hypothetical protein
MASSRKATVPDVHAIASALPEVERDPADPSSPSRAAYKIRGKTFVFFRGPRKDAFDPATGVPYEDVMAFHCAAEDKEAMVGDPDSPWFTTPHWNGYNAVLLREQDLGRITVDELREVVTDAWLARAPKRLAREFLDGRRADQTRGPGAAEVPGEHR